MGQLEGNKSGGQSGSSGGSSGGPGGAGSGGPSGGANPQQANAADQGAQNFGKQNSGQGPAPGGPGAPGTPGGPNGANNQGNPNNINNNPPVAGADQQRQQTSATPTTTTTATQVTVSYGTLGRYISDPIYSGFNTSTLGITYDTTSYRTLASSGPVKTTTTTKTTGNNTTTSTTRTLSLTVPGLGTVDLPWQTDTLTSGYAIPNFQGLGNNLRDGRGYVSPNGEFFAMIFTTTGSNKVGFFGGTPTTSSGVGNFPTSGFGTFAIKSLAGGGRLPFANDGIGDNTNLMNAKVVSSLYAAYSTTLGTEFGVATAISNPRSVALQSTISISGTGNSQVSYMGVFVGQFLRDIDQTSSGGPSRDNGVYLSGSFDGTYRTSSNSNTDDGKTGRLTANASTPSTGTSTGNAIYGTPTGDGAASNIVLNPDKMATTNTFGGSGGVLNSITTTRTDQAAFNQPYTDLNNVNNSYYFVTSATKTTTPTDVGSTSLRNDRTGATAWNGFIGGIAEKIDSGNAYSTRTVTTTDASKMVIDTSTANNRASARIQVDNWATTTGGSPVAVAADFRLGGTTGSNVATSAYVDDNRYAVRDREAGMSDLTTVTATGGTSNVTSNTVMVAYNTAPIDTLFTNANAARPSGADPIQKCVCSFLSWGWWGGDVAYGNASTYNAGGRDRMNFATYVAGTLADGSQLPTNNISATYTGHLVGAVDANGRQYVQAGSYSNNWNFQSRQGQLSIGFDGRSFSGTTAVSGVGSVNFSASVGAGDRTLTLNGAFMGSSSASGPQGQAGSFSIAGPTSGTNAYKAGGTFAAQK